MAADHSFDIVSKIPLQELDNAINMSLKEIYQRFDFKGTKTEIKREPEMIVLISDNEFKLKNVIDILQGKLVKRGVSLKFFEYGPAKTSLGGLVRQEVKIKQGIEQEMAKTINKKIKDLGLKVQTQIQGDQIRVFGKKLDDLQETIKAVRLANFPIELQFINYR